MVEQINTKLIALQTSTQEQQKQHRDHHNEMKLSRDENQLIRDENRQLRDNLKDFKTQLLDAIATRLDKFNEDTNTRLDKISGTTNTQFDKAAKDSKAAFAKAAKESKAGLDKATVMITSCLNNLLKMVRPLQGFLSVSERKQENRIIGLVNRKKGGDAWVPLQDVNDNATINDVTSMSVLNSKSFES